MDKPVLAPFKAVSHDHGHCVTLALDVADELCARQGLRLTVLRRRVLELIWGRHEPVGAYEILDQLRTERRGAAPPTVYRALEFLLDNGLVHRIESLNAYVGCGEPRTAHAGQFLICGRCSAVGELDDPDIATLVAAKARGMGFRVQRQTIEIMGLCPRCATEEESVDAG